MVMRVLCAGFVCATRALLSLLDKTIGTSAWFHAYITEKSHTKNVMYFLDTYAPYVTCMAAPPLPSEFARGW